MSSDLILDYSAHAAWDYCPANWYEKYINRRRKRYPPGQRDDALTLGSLVHAGMEQWQQTHTVGIPQSVVDEMNPTQSCYQLAQELIFGYTRAYPEEHWPLVVCEEALTFPLAEVCPDCFNVINAGCVCGSANDSKFITGLAKIDTYFYVPEVTTIPGGLAGQEITLNPGWWIHEYKTKSPSVPIGLYQQSWETGLQASYQLHALRAKVNGCGDVPEVMDALARYGKVSTEVRGLLVNVMEKPRRHIPKRKCKGCKELLEFALYIPTGRGTYQCHMCGTEQELTALKTDVGGTPPVFYRVLVERSEQQQARDLELIQQTARRMLKMREGGLASTPWTKTNCVSFQYRRACDYFQPHLSGESTIDLAGVYEEPPDYRSARVDFVQLEV